MRAVNKIMGTYYFLRVNQYCYKIQCSNSTLFFVTKLSLVFRIYFKFKKTKH